jgi:3-isopropylmalate/(R)-2-methylmalate dehydratase small subunit
MMAKVHVYDDNVNTDVIYPGRYLDVYDPEQMATYCMEDIDIEFKDRVGEGDLVIGGRNFGCGSSREQAVLCLRYAGVKAIVAGSFARIFFRNAINQGMPAIECPEAHGAFETGDEVELDMEAGVLRNLTKGTEVGFKPIPPFMMEIINDGGLVPHLKNRLGGGD